MYRFIHEKVYKTSDPELFIIAVKSWSRVITVADAIKEYNVIENQKHPARLKINHLLNLEGNSIQRFIPLYFENDVPKLKNLPKLDEGFIWCIAHKNPFITKWVDGHARQITPPPHKEYLRLLKYSLEELNNYGAEHLFEKVVQSHVIKKTDFFDDLQKSQRFKMIFNTTLKVLYPRKYEDKIKPEQYLDFIEKMYDRNIYEFMFNEYLPGR
jgi:hypothetical protein